jgi:hypothetical protein
MGTGASLSLDSPTMASIRTIVKNIFPNINEQFDVTSLQTEDYNCIAWAANDTDRWWWPTNPDRYWPEGIERKETLESFISAFATLGYHPCANGELEEGLEKVVIYCVGGIPKHMARQFPTGNWTSKLGAQWDIKHYEIQGVNGTIYGEPLQFLARNIESI